MINNIQYICSNKIGDKCFNKSLQAQIVHALCSNVNVYLSPNIVCHKQSCIELVMSLKNDEDGWMRHHILVNMVEIRRRGLFAWSRHQNGTEHSPVKQYSLLWGEGHYNTHIITQYLSDRNMCVYWNKWSIHQNMKGKHSAHHVSKLDLGNLCLNDGPQPPEEVWC